MKRFIALILIGVLCLGLCACKKAPEPETPADDTEQTDVKPETPADGADSGEQTTGLTGTTTAENAYNKARREFAYTLFKNCYEKGGNTLVSPTSVQTILALVANGAQDETFAEMQTAVLGGMPMDSVNHAIAQTEDDECLKSANSVWLNGKKGFKLTEEFEKTAQDSYRAEAASEPFDGGTVSKINGWVREHTDGMIDSIINGLTGDEQAVLVNALAFDAKWESPYTEQSVADGKFTNGDGKEVTLPFMSGNEHTYLDDGKATGFIKRYEGGKYAFAALLPNEGVDMDEYVASLSPETLKSATSDTVVTKMPKFSLDYFDELNGALQSMGMVRAFGQNAQFTGIGASPDGMSPFISQVLHKTHIDVYEDGTRAAAATAIVMKNSAGAAEYMKFVTLDRPFVYMIIELDTNVPVFIGVADNLK